MRTSIIALLLAAGVPAACGKNSNATSDGQKTQSTTTVAVVGTGNKVTKAIGAAGGELALEGLTVSVPPGALVAETSLSLTSLKDTDAQGANDVSAIYSLEPASISFRGPVRVSFEGEGDESSALYVGEPGGDKLVPTGAARDGDRLTTFIYRGGKLFWGKNRCAGESSTDARLVCAQTHVESQGAACLAKRGAVSISEKPSPITMQGPPDIVKNNAPLFEAREMIVADFSGDGIADVVLRSDGAYASDGIYRYYYFVGTGDSGLVYKNSFAAPAGFIPQAYLAYDLDADGHPELLALERKSTTPAAQQIEIFAGATLDSAAKPASVVKIDGLPHGRQSLALGVSNLLPDGAIKPDDDVDLFVATSNGIEIYENDGKGGFGARTTTIPYIDADYLVLADVNGDARADVVAGHRQNGTLSITLAPPGGGYPSVPDTKITLNAVAGGLTAVAFARLGSDNFADLVVSTAAGATASLQFFAGQEDGTFKPLAAAAVAPSFIRSMISVDVNGDGFSDLIGSDATTDKALAILSNGQESMSPPRVIKLPAKADFDVGIADVNRDGLVDAVILRSGSGNALSAALGTCQ